MKVHSRGKGKGKEKVKGVVDLNADINAFVDDPL
jgi:hypothetical protein